MKNILKSGFWKCIGLAIVHLFFFLFALIIAIPKLIWAIGKFVVKSALGWIVGAIIIVGLIVGITLLIVL